MTTEDLMTYQVTYTLEVEADSPRSAALAADAILSDPAALQPAPILGVRDDTGQDFGDFDLATISTEEE